MAEIKKAPVKSKVDFRKKTVMQEPKNWTQIALFGAIGVLLIASIYLGIGLRAANKANAELLERNNEINRDIAEARKTVSGMRIEIDANIEALDSLKAKANKIIEAKQAAYNAMEKQHERELKRYKDAEDRIFATLIKRDPRLGQEILAEEIRRNNSHSKQLSEELKQVTERAMSLNLED